MQRTPKLRFILACLLIHAASAWADPLSLPPSLPTAVVSETTASAFAPADFTTGDFRVQWTRPPASAGISAWLAPGTLEWARVGEILVLPRARLVVKSKNRGKGAISNASASQPFVDGRAEIPLALISSEENLVTVSLDGKPVGTLQVRFSPRGPGRRVFFDASCSSLGVSATGGDQQDRRWIYVGCRWVHAMDTGHRAPSIELLVYWDGAGERLRLDGAPLAPAALSTWIVRSRPRRDATLTDGETSVTFANRAPEVDHRASLGLGVGPYAYTVQSNVDGDIHSNIALATLYGSYFIIDRARLVFFDATAIHSRYNSDFGLYLNTRSVTALDNLLWVNLMIGGHALLFTSGGMPRFRVGAPQGLELVLRDLPFRGYALSLGAFLYPPINGTSYNNAWLRFGRAGFFGELNYISWGLPYGAFDANSIYTRSVGFTFGMPLASMF